MGHSFFLKHKQGHSNSRCLRHARQCMQLIHYSPIKILIKPTTLSAVWEDPLAITRQQLLVLRGWWFPCVPVKRSSSPGPWNADYQFAHMLLPVPVVNQQACFTRRVENGRKYSRSDSFRFLFLSVRFCICGIRFHIYGSRNEVSPSVSEKSRFYMELTRIYSVFHPVFNLHKICLKIDMFKNIPNTKYAC